MPPGRVICRDLGPLERRRSPRRVVGDQEEQSAGARLLAVDRCSAPTPATSAAQSFDLDVERDLVAGPNGPSEAHVLDPAQQRQTAGVARIGEDRDGSRLGKGLELEHARHDRIAGEVAGEPRLLPADRPARPDATSGLALVDVVDEAKRRSMSEQADESVSSDSGRLGMIHEGSDPAIFRCVTPDRNLFGTEMKRFRFTLRLISYIPPAPRGPPA
jgi:hypothetical protein